MKVYRGGLVRAGESHDHEGVREVKNPRRAGRVGLLQGERHAACGMWCRVANVHAHAPPHLDGTDDFTRAGDRASAIVVLCARIHAVHLQANERLTAACS